MSAGTHAKHAAAAATMIARARPGTRRRADQGVMNSNAIIGTLTPTTENTAHTAIGFGIVSVIPAASGVEVTDPHSSRSIVHLTLPAHPGSRLRDRRG